MKGQIFISYRREDSAHAAGRLFDRLVKHFGKGQIFMDIDTIEPGIDFAKRIENAVSVCDVLIALIGKRWLSTKDTEGQIRLKNPNDFVRFEIATALRRDIIVIPVLIDGAVMPTKDDLPDDFSDLVLRNAMLLEHQQFDTDANKIILAVEKTIKTITKTQKEQQRISQLKKLSKWGWLIGAIIVLMVAGIALLGIKRYQDMSKHKRELYDDFETQLVKRGFDQIRWTSFGEEFGQVYQEDGRLVISHEEENEAKMIGLDARQYQQFKIEAPNYFQLDMSLLTPEQLNTPMDGQLSFGIYSDTISKDFAGCKLEYGNDLAQYICYYIVSGDEVLFSTGNVDVNFDEWHSFRIEIYPTTMTFKYYKDGQLIGTFESENVEELRNANFDFSMGVNGLHSGVFTGFVDNVMIGTVEQ